MSGSDEISAPLQIEEVHQMNDPNKAELLNKGLERAAEKIGDVTPLAMRKFFDRFPESEAAFDLHWSGSRRELEGQMVENALYCLMTWLDDPQDIVCLLTDSIPHHKLTLKVKPSWYAGLIDATAEAIVETIPKGCADEFPVWRALRDDLSKLVADCEQF